MYKIDRRNIKKGVKFHVVFLTIGLLFGIVLSFLVIRPIFKKNSYDKSVIAYDIELVERNSDDGTTYSPKYYFRYNGENFTCTAGSSSSSVNTNKKLVYFDSNNPSDCLTEYEANPSWWLILLAIGFPSIFIIIGLIGVLNIIKKLKNCNYLEMSGALYKNLPYRMETTGMSVNHRRVLRIVVDFTSASGSVIQLFGDPRHDWKSHDEDGLVDVLIDPNDNSNYFIDFNIEQR